MASWEGRAEVICDKCGGNVFKIEKTLSGPTQDDVVVFETMCHRGFGWDFNSFTYTCQNCQEIEPRVIIKDKAHSDQ